MGLGFGKDRHAWKRCWERYETRGQTGNNRSSFCTMNNNEKRRQRPHAGVLQLNSFAHLSWCVTMGTKAPFPNNAELWKGPLAELHCASYGV